MSMFILFFSVIALAAPLQEGQERGGGKQMELEFAEFGKLSERAVSASLRAGEGLFDSFDLGAFGEALLQTEVWARPEVCEEKITLSTGGASRRCLDARYLSEKNRIELSEAEWAGKSCLEKAALSMHEYGRASGNEDGNYRFSSLVRSSQVFVDACDLRERDIEVGCAEKIRAVKVTLDKVVDDFKSGRFGDKETSEAMFAISLGNITEHWERWGDSSCDNSFEKVCMDACTAIAGLKCVGLVRVLR